MATPPTLTQLPFIGGIDESNRDELLDPAQGFLTLENVRQTERGAFTKRHGTTVLTRSRLDATTRTGGYKVLPHEKQLCTVDGTYLDAYSTTATINVVRSRVPEVGFTTRPSATFGTTTMVAVDIARCNGYVITAYSSGTKLHVTVEDDAQGTVIRGPEVMLTWTNPYEAYCALAWYSVYVILLLRDASSANIVAYYLNTTSSTTLNTGWVSLGNVATDATTTGTAALVVAAQSLNDRVDFAYVNSSGGTSQVTVKGMTISGVLQTQTINTSSVKPNTVQVEGSNSDTLWVAWNETTTIKIRGLDADNLTATALASTASMITAGTTPSAFSIGIVSSTTTGAGRVIYNDGDGLEMRDFVTSAGAATTSGSQTLIPGVQMGAKPINYNGRYYGIFYPVSTTSFHDTAIFCDFTTLTTFMRPVANIDSGLSRASHNYCHIDQAGTGKYVVPVQIQRSGIAENTVIVRLDFTSTTRWQSVRHGDATFLTGGVLSYFDGSRVAEVGFLHRPFKPSTASSSTGITGTFRYIAVFEETDGNGNWCQSATSDPSDAITVSNKTITVTLVPLAMSARITTSVETRVRIALYRTATGGLPPYYRLTVVNNDTSSGTVTYADTTTDGILTANAKLYRQPGILGTALTKEAPPGTPSAVSYNGVLAFTSGSNIRFSGQDVYGEETWCSSVFQVPIPGPGDVTAVWAQDGTLFAAKLQSIYALSGDAPSDNGSTGGIGTPRKLAVDLGCKDPRSVVTTALGTFFQSERGIELLTRGQVVTWVGEKVQDRVAAFPVITSATLDAAAGLVYFTCAASETANQVSSSGIHLVYDLTLQSWVSVDKQTSQGGTASIAAQSACYAYDGTRYRYTWIDTSGYVYQESDNYLDGSSTYWVTMKAETGWIKTAGVQGYQMMNRVLVLSKYATDHNISLSLAYDYSSSYKTANTWTRALLASVNAALPNQQLEHPLHNESECQSVRVKLEDATPTGGTVGTGQGATWIALTFEGTPRQGAVRLPAVSR